jgi:hypothetical protein
MKISNLIGTGMLMIGVLLRGPASAAVPSDATQTASGGGVIVKVSYLNPRSNEDPRFRVVLDTHSVGLDGYDLKSLAVLRTGTGKDYLPTAVENKGSGHHREVVLTFPKVGLEAKHLEVTIKDVAGVKERTFRWKVE